MKTSAISNPANITQSLTANKPEGANADVPFSQVLSRETSKASIRETSPAPQSQAQPSTPVKSKAADAGNAKEAAEDGQENNATAQDAASAEMLALVASLVQANPVASDPNALQAGAEGAALAVDILSAAAVGEADLTAGLRADLLGKLPPGGAHGVQDGTLPAASVIATDFQGKLQAAGPGDQTASQASALAANLAAATELPAKTQTLTDTQAKTTLPSAQDGAAADLDGKEGAAKTGFEPSAAVDRSGESRQLQDFGASRKPEAQISQPAPELIAIKAQEAPAPNAAALGQVQHANLAASHAMGANQTEKLAPQVGRPGWDQALGQKVVWMVAGGQQSASLTLNPPDLGPLQVVLNVSNAQATASFTAAQPEVRQALEAALPKLREMLAESGIQLGQTSVGSGAPNQFSAPGDQSSRSQRQFTQGIGGETPAPAARAVAQSNGLGMIDTFA